MISVENIETYHKYTQIGCLIQERTSENLWQAMELLKLKEHASLNIYKKL